MTCCLAKPRPLGPSPWEQTHSLFTVLARAGPLLGWALSFLLLLTSSTQGQALFPGGEEMAQGQRSL